MAIRLAGGGALPAAAVRAAVAVATVIAGAAVYSDWFHRRRLVFYRPRGPLATGVVRAGEARWFGVGLLAVGLALAASLGSRPLAAALAVAAVMLSLNLFLEAVYLGRNAVTAASAVLPLGYGWFLSSAVSGEKVVFAAVAAALMALSASVFADVHLAEADEVTGRRTLAALAGRWPILIAGGLAVGAGAVLFAPYLFGAYSRRYVAIVGAVAALMVFYSLLNVRRAAPDPVFAGSTARMVKFLIFVVYAGVYWETLA